MVGSISNGNGFSANTSGLNANAGLNAASGFPLPIRHREPRHLKTSSSGSIPPGPFPPIDEALDFPSALDGGLGTPRLYPASKCPQGLDLSLSAAALRAYRDRSPTSSTMSSSVLPDSATIYSMPMSPTSSTFTRATTPDVDGHELDLAGIQGLQAAPDGTQRHRKRMSLSSLFRFLNHRGEDEGDGVGEGRGMNENPVKQEDEDMTTPSTPSASSMHDHMHMHMPQATRTPRPPPEDREATPEAPPLKQKFSFDTSVDRLSRSSSSSVVRNTFVPPEPLMDVHREDADSLLNYVLQSTYGVDLDEIGGRPTLLRHLASRFIQDVGRIAFSGPVHTQLTHTTSTTSSGSLPLSRHTSASARGSQNGGKRKKAGDDDNGSYPSDDDDANAGGPPKKARPGPREAPDPDNLRLGCPFRKRNPSRFNVRQHHSCAMTYFPKFAELRQHIVKQHKRVDPTAFLCDRCSREFASRKDLRDHQRLPRELMCDIADHDPESGIDGPTATKLLSRKRASGTTPEVQWAEIWHLLFPDDEDHEVKAWDFCPVIEHFEITNRFMDGLKSLEGSLRNKGLNESVLETIGNLYRNRLIQVVEQCVDEARNRPYSNRSNRRGDTIPAAVRPGMLFGRGAPRPDSGVDLDEGSSEGDGFSVGLLSTYGLGQDEHAGGLRRSESVGTEVRAGAGGRVLMPLVEGGAVPEGFPAVDETFGMGVPGEEAWGADMAQVSMPPLWAEYGDMTGGALMPQDMSMGVGAGMVPQGLSYPGWGTDGMYDFSGQMPR